MTDAARFSAAEVALAAHLELRVEMYIAVRAGKDTHFTAGAFFFLNYDRVALRITYDGAGGTDSHTPWLFAVQAGHGDNGVLFNIMVYSYHGGLALAGLFRISKGAGQFAVTAAYAF